MANLFEKAVKKTTAVVKNEKIVVNPKMKPDEAKKFQSDFKKLVKLQAQIAELVAESKGYEEEIRYQAKKSFIETYGENGKNPDSFLFESGPCSVMVIPTDKYKKIDEERYNTLSTKWGEETVSKKTEYKFNEEMLEKYADEISSLIEKSKKIEANDKNRIIEASVAYSVAKGAIDKAPEKKEQEYLEDISPVIMLKNFKA